jgi:hypothetical protein
MPFGSKDLLTKALPHAAIDAAQIAKLCFFHTCICRWPTFCFITCPRLISDCGRCSLLLTDIVGCQIQNSCGAGRSACDPTQFCFGSDPWVIQDLEDLVTIRAELNRTLEQLAGLEKEGLASGITTREQADELEKTLTGQLEHLRSVRKGLK